MHFLEQKESPSFPDVTCNSSSSEQLQRPQSSLLVCHRHLGVGINGEVDGREGDVTEEAGFGSLMEEKDHLNVQYTAPTRAMVIKTKWSASRLIQPMHLRGGCGDDGGAKSLRPELLPPKRNPSHCLTEDPGILAPSTKRKSAIFFNKPHTVCYSLKYGV